MISNDTPNDHRWLLVLLAVLAAVVFVYPLLLDIPLLDPDEGLHASIAQEMVERGRWIIPSFLGEPFLDKPILYFWAEALSLRIFGFSEAAVRLPGLMFGLLGVLTTAIVGWRMFGRTVGLVAGIFYATMILPVALAQAAAHDVALVPLVNLAVLLFWEADRERREEREERREERTNSLTQSLFSLLSSLFSCYPLAIGVLLGLAVLTKGLVGVALVGTAYGGYLLLTRRLTVAVCVRGAAALGIAAAVASMWYIAVELHNPGYLYYYFVERHLLGFATDTQTHGGEPWWYYLPILLVGGLPWIGYLPVTVRDGFARWRGDEERGEKREERGERRKRIPLPNLFSLFSLPSSLLPPSPFPLLWSWLIGCTLLLSLANSKMVTYIWPVFPAVAILAAIGWARLIDGTLTDGARHMLLLTVVLSCIAGPAVLPVVLLVVQGELDIRFSWPVWLAACAAAATAMVPLLFIVTGRWRAMLTAATLSTAVQFVVVMTFVLPPVAAGFSARDLAGYFNRTGTLPPKLLIAEERIGSLVFYLDDDLRAGLYKDQFQQVHLGEFPSVEPGTVVVVPEQHVDWLARYANLNNLAYESAGRYRLYDAMELSQRLSKTATGR